MKQRPWTTSELQFAVVLRQKYQLAASSIGARMGRGASGVECKLRGIGRWRITGDITLPPCASEVDARGVPRPSREDAAVLARATIAEHRRAILAERATTPPYRCGPDGERLRRRRRHEYRALL